MLVVAGTLLGVVLVLGVLLARGELAGYGDAMLENLAYPALTRADISSFRTGATLWEKATTVFTTPLVTAYLALLGLSAGLLVVQGGRRGPQAWATPEGRAAALALTVGLGTFVMVRTASWWVHHFHAAPLAFVLALVPALLLAARLPRPLAVGAMVAVFLVIGAMLTTPTLTGKFALQTPTSRPADLCDIVMRAGRRIPSRQECAVFADAYPDGTRFATIQQNNPGSLAAWTPPTMQLACRVFYQFPWFRPELLDELADCLERGDVDVIFRGPLSYDVPRLQRRLDGLLRREFRLVHRYGEVEVWQRR
jgi:hypothetical protein